jgi:transketolase
MKKYNYTEKKDTRSGFGSGLLELGKSNENVVTFQNEVTFWDFPSKSEERVFFST